MDFLLYIMNDLELDVVFTVFKQLEPKLSDYIQLYDSVYLYRFAHMVRFVSKNKTIAVWLDFSSLNEYKLKILFKNHNKLQYNFFIQQIGNFYRVGWKM